jgi:beta-lactamase class A
MRIANHNLVAHISAVPFALILLCVQLSAAVFAVAQAKPTDARAEIERLIREAGPDVTVAVVAEPLDQRSPRFTLAIRDGEAFHAASTMKIPVMIELYRQAKAGNLTLDDPLPVKNEFHSLADGSVFRVDDKNDSDPEPYKKAGGTMTLRELCEHMITRSSNFATNLLIQKLGVDNIRATVHSLGADGMQVLRGVEDGKAFEKGMNNTTTARGLATLLEAIARNTAADPVNCHQMIEILERQEFHEAIPAGLPPGTVVAHKTGEITKIHHDAAIVFAKRPFVLVILVRGIADRDQSSKLMAGITRVVYQAIQ